MCPQAYLVSRDGFTERHGSRHLTSASQGGGGGGDSQQGQVSAASSAQAKTGWKFVEVVMTLILKLLKK